MEVGLDKAILSRLLPYMEVDLDRAILSRLLPYMEVGHHPSTKAIFFSANQLTYCFAPQTKIAQAQNKSDHFFSQSVCPFNESDIFSANRVFYCYEVSVHLVIPDWNHAACGSVCRR
jgi:hypothetical protein